jgi:hypothetical protein
MQMGAVQDFQGRAMQRSLRIDVLEGRALPSLILGQTPPPAPTSGEVAVPTMMYSHPAAILSQPTGHLAGTYTRTISVDSGSEYSFTGAGHTLHLGATTVTGTIDTVGSVRAGHATGTLTITGANGSLTLQVTGPAQHFFARLPHEFRYQVISGTGVDANVHSRGTLLLGTTAAGDFHITIR